MIKAYFLIFFLGLTSVYLISSDALYNKALSFQTLPTETTREEVMNTISMSNLQDSLFTTKQIQKAKDIIAHTSEADKSKVKAKAKYNMLCAACHGGKGDLEINGSKSLIKSTLTLEESVARIYYGRDMMTAFSELLTEAEIVAIAEFIKLKYSR
jgi:mono/diheme cytochrome c family protein